MSPRGKKAKVETRAPSVMDSTAEVEAFKPEKDTYNIPIEVVPSIDVSPLEIYDVNPAYIYRWCNKNEMGAGRRGIWHTILKDMDNFKGLRVQTDHTPTQNFFSVGDVVLCAARKETVFSRRKRETEKIKLRDRKMKEGTTETLAKVSKDNIGVGIKTLDKVLNQ